jgi:uncharacterized protein YegP (UPF0339 family)
MIEVFTDEAGQFRFRVKGGNGEIVAQSEGYTRANDAVRGVNTLGDIIGAWRENGSPVRFAD